MSSQRSALSALSDNPFGEEDFESFAGSRSTRGCVLEGTASTGQPFIANASSGKVAARSYITTSGREWCDGSSWANDGGVTPSTPVAAAAPAAMPVRPPGILEDVHGWTRVASVQSFQESKSSAAVPLLQKASGISAPDQLARVATNKDASKAPSRDSSAIALRKPSSAVPSRREFKHGVPIEDKENSMFYSGVGDTAPKPIQTATLRPLPLLADPDVGIYCDYPPSPSDMIRAQCSRVAAPETPVSATVATMRDYHNRLMGGGGLLQRQQSPVKGGVASRPSPSMIRLASISPLSVRIRDSHESHISMLSRSSIIGDTLCTLSTDSCGVSFSRSSPCTATSRSIILGQSVLRAASLSPVLAPHASVLETDAPLPHMKSDEKSYDKSYDKSDDKSDDKAAAGGKEPNEPEGRCGGTVFASASSLESVRSRLCQSEALFASSPPLESFILPSSIPAVKLSPAEAGELHSAIIDSNVIQQAVKLSPAEAGACCMTLDESSSDFDEEDSNVPTTPWTGKKPALDWSFIPKGGSPLPDESSLCVGKKAPAGLNPRVLPHHRMDASLETTVDELAKAEEELRKAVAMGGSPVVRAVVHLMGNGGSSSSISEFSATPAIKRPVPPRAPGQDLLEGVVLFGGCEDAVSGRIVTGCEVMSLLQVEDEGCWHVSAGPEGVRGASGVAHVHGGCFLAGGYDGTAPRDDAVMMMPGGEWEKMPGRMRQARFSCGSAALDSRVVAVGGSDGVQVLSSSEVYDVATGEWSTLPGAMNRPRAGCGCAAVGGKLYAVGGYGEDGRPMASAEVYDDEVGRWEVLPGGMREARMDCGVAAVGHLLVIVGGRGATGEVLESCEVFDTQSKEGFGWSLCAGHLNTPRAGMGLVSIGGKVLAIAGSDGIGLLSSWEEYDVAEDKWRMRNGRLTHSRGACCAVVLGSAVTSGDDEFVML